MLGLVVRVGESGASNIAISLLVVALVMGEFKGDTPVIGSTSISIPSLTELLLIFLVCPVVPVAVVGAAFDSKLSTASFTELLRLILLTPRSSDEVLLTDPPVQYSVSVVSLVDLVLLLYCGTATSPELKLIDLFGLGGLGGFTGILDTLLGEEVPAVYWTEPNPPLILIDLGFGGLAGLEGILLAVSLVGSV